MTSQDTLTTRPLEKLFCYFRSSGLQQFPFGLDRGRKKTNSTHGFTWNRTNPSCHDMAQSAVEENPVKVNPEMTTKLWWKKNTHTHKIFLEGGTSDAEQTYCQGPWRSNWRRVGRRRRSSQKQLEGIEGGPKGIPVWGSSSEYLSSIIILSLSFFRAFLYSAVCASRVNLSIQRQKGPFFLNFVYFFLYLSTGVRFSVFPYGHFPFKRPMVNILGKG